MNTTRDTKNERNRTAKDTPGRLSEQDVERLLVELTPVEPPPFHRERLLARLGQEATRPAWSHALHSPRLAWTVAAVCVIALTIALTTGSETDHPAIERQGAVPPGEAVAMSPDDADIALATDVAPVMPTDNAVVGAGDVEIVAAIQPPLEAGGIVRLLVDDRDVTSLADITDSYVMYSPTDSFDEGEHIITIEISDGSGRALRHVSWLFYALNGKRAAVDERV
jgi:hypothetical protein